MITRSTALRLIASAVAMPAALVSMGSACAKSLGADRTAREDARARLARVTFWGCQYQNIDLVGIAGSPLDLVVIEPIIDGGTGRAVTSDEIDLLKRKPTGERRLVLAYLSVGAAEEYRPYWKPEWKTGQPPEWLGMESPEWPRSYSVRYWNPEWQQIVTDALARLVEAGYDGVFMDRVDAFHDWRETRASALADMADFMTDLARAARSRNSGFLMIGQNAEQLLRNSTYLETIDAVSKESLLTGLQGQDKANTADDIEWSLAYLLPAQAAGKTILTIEYAQERVLVAKAAAEYKRLGFVPFFGTRLLDRLP